jgi:hypothetical protein
MQAGIVQAICQIVTQIPITDRLAGRKRAVAKDQERLAAFDPIELTGEGLKKSCRPDNRIDKARLDQHLFESQFSLLEGQDGLLNTNGRKQNNLAYTRPARRLKRLDMGSMINRPSIRRFPCTRCETGNEYVKSLATKPLTLK